MSNPPGVWVVRGGDNNELAQKLAQKKAVAIGWQVSDVSGVRTRDELRKLMEKDGVIAKPSSVGQVFRFAKDIAVGDFILTPEQANSTVHITRCTGDYEYSKSVFNEEYPHVRRVDYLKRVPRAGFPVTVRNTLGSTLTVFRADIALPYVQQLLGETPSLAPFADEKEPEAEDEYWAETIEYQARGQIQNQLDEIEHHEFQTFVAGLLQTLGYKTRVGAKGKDGGVDVLAHPDTFGFATPRIKVQTKNQRSTAGVQEVGYLHGILEAKESGLFICTGGFSADALKAPFVRNGRIALVKGEELLELILENYEKLPQEARDLLPLRRVYVPETKKRS